jgi:hypothetical protein
MPIPDFVETGDLPVEIMPFRSEKLYCGLVQDRGGAD